MCYHVVSTANHLGDIVPTTTFTLPNPSDIVSTWWGEQERIGQAYLDMVQREHQSTPEEVAAWKALARESHHDARAVRQMFAVHVTPDPEPYPSSKVMQERMCSTGRMLVSSANCEHPIWTPEQNVDFRIVHDGMGHYISGGAFSWQGELDACGVHFRMVTNANARRALFTECIGQIAAFYVGGEHAPQVCGFLPERFTRGKLHA